MNWYSFGLSSKEIRKGSRGPPGNGFKLTDDGEYDMEKKKLKNVDEPKDISDAATKSYVDSTGIDLKKKMVELEKRSLIHSEHGDFDAKNKIIGNVKDPVHDKNVVTKQYFENNALVLNEGKFDAKSISIKNLTNPQDKNDAVSKHYVDRKTKINDKKPDNMLTRDHDGLYVSQALTFFLATNEEIMAVFDKKDDVFLLDFNVFTSNLLTPELQLTTNMLMKITLFFERTVSKFWLEIFLSGEIIYREDFFKMNPFILIAYGKRNDKLTITLTPKSFSAPLGFHVKPYLYIEKLSEFNI